ncbi:DUF4190 domain-containing protein [Pseudonocardia endophytica]|uniref:Uncharacterized protein DUF4352 n=1 Tax=Pseudonocardia endophytica TaxID=401976 RepID=A0A4V2PJ36_PSEEN|nr:DUF4190 domain-containing protein [Pseudonocardia endophytica]TCK26996.1 uncharacterized protein DUF4352 [Pseudonocardia endophytica]
MTTPQNPYGPQAQPAQPYAPNSYPRHAAPATQWNAGPQQPFQASMSTGYPQQGGYAPQGNHPQSHDRQSYAPQGPAQGYGGYAGPASGPHARQDFSAPAGLPQQPAAGIPAQRSGEPPLPQYPSGGGQPPRPPRNGLGTTALVLGILAVLFAMIPIIGMIAWPLSILGLIFGIVGVVRLRSGKADNKGVAISGTVLSAIGLILCVVWVAAFSNAVATTPAPSTGSVPASSGSTQSGGAFPGATTSDVIGKPGETLTVGDMQVTASALKPGDSTLGKTLCTTVTYKYNGSTTGSFNGGFDWKLQDPNGAALMTGFTGSDKALSAGQLAPGGTTSGDVCFDQNNAASGQYVLLYDAMTFSSDRGAWLNQVG